MASCRQRAELSFWIGSELSRATINRAFKKAGVSLPPKYRDDDSSREDPIWEGALARFLNDLVS